MQRVIKLFTKKATKNKAEQFKRRYHLLNKTSIIDMRSNNNINECHTQEIRW